MCQDQIPFRLVSVIILQSIKQTLATPIRKRISDPTRCYERFTRKEERYLFVKGFGRQPFDACLGLCLRLHLHSTMARVESFTAQSILEKSTGEYPHYQADVSGVLGACKHVAIGYEYRKPQPSSRAFVCGSEKLQPVHRVAGFGSTWENSGSPFFEAFPLHTCQGPT